jgi:hypothetical protein
MKGMGGEEGKEGRKEEGDGLAPNKISGSATAYLTGKRLYNIEHYSH